MHSFFTIRRTDTNENCVSRRVVRFHAPSVIFEQVSTRSTSSFVFSLQVTVTFLDFVIAEVVLVPQIQRPLYKKGAALTNTVAHR